MNNQTYLLSNEQKIDMLDNILMGRFIVHRLINEFDKSVIEKASAEEDKTLVAYLHMLTRLKKLYWSVSSYLCRL